MICASPTSAGGQILGILGNPTTWLLLLFHFHGTKIRSCLLTAPLPSLSPSPQYLGYVEVEESRGMQVCEEAVKKLKAVRVQLVRGLMPKESSGQTGGCAHILGSEQWESRGLSPVCRFLL